MYNVHAYQPPLNTCESWHVALACLRLEVCCFFLLVMGGVYVILYQTSTWHSVIASVRGSSSRNVILWLAWLFSRAWVLQVRHCTFVCSSCAGQATVHTAPYLLSLYRSCKHVVSHACALKSWRQDLAFQIVSRAAFSLMRSEAQQWGEQGHWQLGKRLQCLLGIEGESPVSN